MEAVEEMNKQVEVVMAVEEVNKLVGVETGEVEEENRLVVVEVGVVEVNTLVGEVTEVGVVTGVGAMVGVEENRQAAVAMVEVGVVNRLELEVVKKQVGEGGVKTQEVAVKTQE